MNERPKKQPRFSAEARARLAKTLGAAAKIERRADRTSPWPLSSGQERLWLAEELLGPSPLYHVPLAAHLVGPLDVRALEQALAALLSRHELLRARIARDGESLAQTITDGLGFRLARHALQGGRPAENYARALELARAEYRRPFDLARELPLRAALWSLGPDEHLLLLTVHHLVCDGITIHVLCTELAEHYAAERSRRPLSLIEPELQHGDYAAWQRTRLEADDVRSAVAHVAARLADGPAPLELPSDHPRPARWTVRGGWQSQRLAGGLATSLEELARAHGATPFQLFLAAFHALLFRWTRQEDLVIGVPATLRDQPELERLPGFLVNTLPVRTRVEGALTFVELLARVRESALDAFEHKQAPFERVLEVLRPARDPARTPLFQVMFDHRAGLAHELALEGLTSGRLLGEDELHSGTAKVDLALYTELTGGELVLSAEYRSDLFDQATIARLLERLAVLLRGLAAHPHARLDELPWLGDAERALVLETWARGPRVADCERTLQATFAEVAARLGPKVALEHGAERVTYGELLARARRLAQRLVELGVERGEPVALCLTRSSRLVVAELAILEAGGAYLPLDPNYPVERLRFMLRDSLARVLVSESALLAELPCEGLAVLDLDAERAALDAGPVPAPRERSGPGDPAYLIYTSGSTGAPKGVACPHRGVLRLFRGAPWLVFDERVRMVHLAPESFDASILDLWGPLLGGGTLVLHPEKTPTLAGLARVVAEHRIDSLFLTTALFHALVDEAPETLARLRQVATGGEALSLPHLQRARRAAPELALANCYGPTEATVIATTWCAPRPLPTTLAVAPIGTPVANTDVLVLDARGEPAAIGVAGELHVGGDSIALGYWKRPELTAERFVPDPRGAGRLYRTGDLARWCADGTLEFLGRGDDQVKIRGHRIELAEIENRLAEHPHVRRALVVAQGGPDGTQRLVAYAVPGEARPSAAELLAHLAARLPEYMRPSACVLLDELPVTPGGKIDRARLPLPELTAASGLRTPPLGSTEECLAQLWRELLGTPDVAREDDFFALGGHSLSATVLIARVAKQFGVELPLATLFEARTLAELARAVGAARAPVAPVPVPPRPGTPQGPLSANQRGLWFLQELAPGNAFYNVPFALPLAGPLDPGVLARALAEVVRRHEALRTVYPVVGGEPVARVTDVEPELETLDLRARAPAQRDAQRDQALSAFARRPFDLARGPLLRACLVREEEERATLAVAIHHIAFDGWSFDVFLAELAALYDAGVRGAPLELPVPANQYADHAWRQQHELTPARRTAELAFWKQELDGAPLVLELPTDRPRPATPSWRGAKVTRALPAELVARLTALARAEGATPYLVALTVAEILLARHAGVEDFVLGTPVAGRARAESERSIGLYLNVLALRADLRGRPSFRTLLARTRARVLAAHGHQDFPFESLVEALAVERDPAVTPVYQVLFSLRHAARAARAGGLTIAPALELDAASAKTDLALTLEERPGDWLLDLTFAADLFEVRTMERVAERFETLLASALERPEECVFELEQCPPAERALVAGWSGATPAYPRDEGLAALFERAVERSPQAVAVSLEGATLTYAALNARANRLARELATLGVVRGSRVGLCVDRSLDLPVALLAILKAGGAYVPLDPSYPKERLELMLTDAGVEVLLVDEHLVAELPEGGARRVVLGSLGDLARHADTNPEPVARGEDLAYVMYTSGSTGKPKGVEIPQRAVARLVCGARYATFDASRVWLQLAPISFDASTLELWGALLHGARLALYPERIPTAEDLERVLRAEQVTSLWLTAALFNAIIDERPQALAGVRECLTGGEALSVAHVQRAYAALPPTVTLINGYGPTENTTFTCCYRIPRELPADAASIPIGRPLENTSVFVVDRELRPVPIGVAGELVTGGDGLARGYRGRPELDAERFVASPLDGRRLYRTGDRVRWLSDGRIEFLGRNDDQVKIRGHRIEPGEIAVVLATHPRVRKAFVAVHEAAASGKTLVAYLEARDGAAPSSSELSSWLAERIPSYMIPSAFVPMEALPMNANGKVDRKKLPEPVFETRSASGPRNDMEGLLATLWQDVLKVGRVGPDDDFFELGGHSLLAVKLVQAIKDAFGQELELASLVATPTLAEMALSLHHGIGTQRSSALVKLQPKGDETPVFCVCSLGGTVLNQRPLAVRLPERPFYGLQAVELDAKLGRPALIEDYATAYIEAMKKVQPRGPYIVGGHSFGGIVSFEVAQQLQKGGDEVEMLFILDSSLPNLDKGALDRLACIFAFLRGLPYLPAETLQQMKSDPEHMTRALKQKLRFVARKTGLASAPKPAPGPRPLTPPAPGNDPGSMRVADIVDMTNWPENNQRIAQRHLRAVQDYRPQPYPGRITLFRSRFQSPFLGLGSEMGWDRVAKGGVEVVRVPGGHLSVLQPPNVDVLARRFLERLKRRRRAA